MGGCVVLVAIGVLSTYADSLAFAGNGHSPVPFARLTTPEHQGASGPFRPHYEMQVAQNGTRLRIKACFGGRGLAELIPGEPFGRPYLRQSKRYRREQVQEWSFSARGISFPKQDGPFCVLYEIDLEAALQSAGARVAERIGGAISLDPDLFLYRPARLSSIRAATMAICVPQDWSVSVPWPDLTPQERVFPNVDCVPDKERGLEYLLQPSVFLRRGRVFIGAFPQRQVQVGQTTFAIALLNGPGMQGRGIENWLRKSARAVEQIYGDFPRKRVQVSLRFTPGSGAHFGMVFRAGGVGAHFWLGEKTRASDLRHDWVGVHELSHLSLPFIRTSEPWLSEGIATYYQYLLQARAGWISEAEFFSRLVGGIRSATAGSQESLRDAAAKMAHSGGYRRVYWGGASLIWLADVALRVRSENRASLDVALKRLSGCCMPSERRWTAQALYRKLDELTGNSAFEDVFTAHLDRRSPPPLDELLNKLGIAYRQGRVELRDHAPWAHIRRAMVAPVKREAPIEVRQAH